MTWFTFWPNPLQTTWECFWQTSTSLLGSDRLPDAHAEHVKLDKGLDSVALNNILEAFLPDGAHRLDRRKERKCKDGNLEVATESLCSAVEGRLMKPVSNNVRWLRGR